MVLFTLPEKYFYEYATHLISLRPVYLLKGIILSIVIKEKDWLGWAHAIEKLLDSEM